MSVSSNAYSLEPFLITRKGQKEKRDGCAKFKLLKDRGYVDGELRTGQP